MKINLSFKKLFCSFCCMLFFACPNQTAKLLPSPPNLLATAVLDEKTLKFFFDQDVTIKEPAVSPALPAYADKNMIILDQPMQPGQRYKVKGKAVSARASLVFQAEIYGYNRDRAALAFNEVRIKHDKKRAEQIELRVTKSGNLAGITVRFIGPSQTQSRYIFANRYVAAGQLIVIECRRPSGSFFWDRQGLPDQRGILLLDGSPHSDPLDAFIYSSQATENAVFNRQLQELQQCGRWEGPPASSQKSSPTRTFNYIASGKETTAPAAQNWQLCPARHDSIGKPNSLQKFTF